MKQVFQTVWELSLSGSWMILALLLLRLCLRRLPKWGDAALWGLVGIRLLIPFHIESRFSLIPGMPVPQYTFTETVPLPDVGEVPTVTAPDWDPINLITLVWFVGVLLFLLWFAFSYFRLKSKLNTAVRLRGNIYQSEFIASPMVAGFVRPRIYLPFRVDAACFDPILAHEQAHIRRGDQWWKLLAFACLAVHWFNPLVWLAYMLFGRDVEFACDEAVIKKLDQKGRADYAQALMVYGTRGRGFSISLMAFGRTDTKGRIKAVAHYKRPAVRNILLLTACCVLLMVCFLTDPVTAVKEQAPDDGFAQLWEEKDPITTVPSGGTSKPGPIPAPMEPSVEEMCAKLADLQHQLAFYQSCLARDMKLLGNDIAKNPEAKHESNYTYTTSFYRKVIAELETSIAIMENKINKL